MKKFIHSLFRSMPLADSSSACPHCGEIQSPPPKRKKKCQSCGQSIYVRKEGRRQLLMTEKQVKDAEKKQRDEQWKDLSQQAKSALQTGDWEAASQAYLGQAAILFAEGREHLHVTEEVYRCQLRGMRKIGIKNVEVLTCDDERVCLYCNSLKGKVFSVSKALKTMPLPGKTCADGNDKNPHGGRCRCTYLAVMT